MLTTILDVLGVSLIAACAFYVWPPAALGVLGAGCLIASWRIVRGSR